MLVEHGPAGRDHVNWALLIVAFGGRAYLAVDAIGKSHIVAVKIDDDIRK